MQGKETIQANTEGEKNRALLSQLEMCCHFLHHRRGGRHGQARLLRLLLERGQLTQRELQEMLHIQSGSISELVGKLEGGGLILRDRLEEDRRQVILQISEKGRQALAQHEQENSLQESQLFTVLSSKEQQQLFELLDKLLDSWRTRYDRELFHHRCVKPGKEGRDTCSNT